MTMPSMKYRILSKIAALAPVPLTSIIGQNACILPYYHMVSDQDPMHVRHLYRYKNVKEFRSDVDFLLRRYRPICLADVLDRVKLGQSLPEQSFLLTFDDGFREMHEVVAPILLEKGVSALFFLNSDFLDNKKLSHEHKASLLVDHVRRNGSVALNRQILSILKDNRMPQGDVVSGLMGIGYHRQELLDDVANLMGVDFDCYLRTYKPYLTSVQVRGLLESGFGLGAHSKDHPMYSTLSLEDQVSQTIESVKAIREAFGLTYGVFAFPYTDADISRDFFLQVLRGEVVDLCFGTSGILNDSFVQMLQRFSLENPLISAERILAYQYAKKLGRVLRGCDKIVRN